MAELSWLGVLRHGQSSGNVAAEAAEVAGVDLPLPAVLAAQLYRGVEAGHGDEDMAAAVEASRAG